MKLSIVTLLALPALAAAFIPAQPRAFVTSLGITKEEDLELTRKVIAGFMDEDAPEPAEEKKEAPAKDEKDE